MLRCVNTSPAHLRPMAKAASLAYRGVTLTLSTGTILAFAVAFNPDMYLCSLMSSDMTGKALANRVSRKKSSPMLYYRGLGS